MTHRMGAALLVMFVSAGSAGVAYGQDVGVKLSLDDYEHLRAVQEGPAVTVIESLQLTGTFRNRDLGVTINGRSYGRKEAVSVISSAGAVRLYGCDGEGIVQRDGDAFTVTPLAAKFAVHCRLSSPTNDRLELVTTPAVLWVQSAVSDGDLVQTDETNGSRSLSIVRQTAGSADVVKLSATGHYHITLQPGETAFQYEIDVQNPNRVHQPFDIRLASGEHVQDVEARVAYDVVQRDYRLDLPPGDSSIVMTGTLTGDSFTPPVDASEQYLLLEADPLLRLTVDQTPRRISPRETGMTPKFRGAQAFLVATGRSTSWQVKKLDVLRTTSFAVSSATHHFYVSRDGETIAESTYQINNQGAAALALPMKAQPTYAALDGQAVLMTKNPAGDFYTPLSMGDQSLTVQFRQSIQHRFGLAWGTLWLPQMATPASRTGVQVAYPKQWLPVFESFRGDARLWSPGEVTILWMTILSVWTWMVAGALGLQRRKRLVVAGAAAVSVLAVPWAWACIAAGDLIVTVLITWRHIGVRTSGNILAAGAACFVVFVVTHAIFGSDVRQLFGTSTAALSADQHSYNGNTGTYYGAKSLANFGNNNDATTRAKPNSRESNGTYQGLPARIDIPAGARSTWFQTELLRTDRPRGVQIVLLRTWIVEWAQLLLGLLALGLITREIKVIRDGVRKLWPAPSVPASPEPAPAA